MKVLLCHNYYQHRGGEDQVHADEADLLRLHGHEIVQYTAHNDHIAAMARWDVARRTLWNRQSYHEVRTLLRRERPHLVHCTNTFPLISPSAYYAAQAEGVPVIQSLHNFRLLCPNACLLRDQQPCEDCLGKRLPWPGVVHACYRGSRAATLVVAAMLALHRAKRTWTRAVDQYIALTEFSRQKFIAGGLPAEKIAVKPNCVHPDPGPGAGRGAYAVFVGRLSPEKGIDVLLDAWKRLGDRIPLKIVGDGPLAGLVRAAATANSGVEFLGRRPLDEVLALLGDAAFLVMPSVWYETFGRTIIEAFAKATPVIASRLGAMAELVDHGRTGLLFEPGDADDLVRKVEQWIAGGESLTVMRHAARREYELKYGAERNYASLVNIYRETLLRCGRPVDGDPQPAESASMSVTAKPLDRP